MRERGGVKLVWLVNFYYNVIVDKEIWSMISKKVIFVGEELIF